MWKRNDSFSWKKNTRGEAVLILWIRLECKGKKSLFKILIRFLLVSYKKCMLKTSCKTNYSLLKNSVKKCFETLVNNSFFENSISSLAVVFGYNHLTIFNFYAIYVYFLKRNIIDKMIRASFNLKQKNFNFTIKHCFSFYGG